MCYAPRPDEADLLRKYSFLRRLESATTWRTGMRAQRMEQHRASRTFYRVKRHWDGKPCDVLDAGGGDLHKKLQKMVTDDVGEAAT